MLWHCCAYRKWHWLCVRRQTWRGPLRLCAECGAGDGSRDDDGGGDDDEGGLGSRVLSGCCRRQVTSARLTVAMVSNRTDAISGPIRYCAIVDLPTTHPPPSSLLSATFHSRLPPRASPCAVQRAAASKRPTLEHPPASQTGWPIPARVAEERETRARVCVHVGPRERESGRGGEGEAEQGLKAQPARPTC